MTSQSPLLRRGLFLWVILSFTIGFYLLPILPGKAQQQGGKTLYLPTVSYIPEAKGGIPGMPSSPRQPPVLPTGGQEFFVSPSGSSSGDGSRARPWDLTTALDHPAAVRPGDTLWLLGGVYGGGGSTRYTSRLEGTGERPILVRGYPGERARVNGGILAEGAWTWFWGFEIFNSSTERTGDAVDRPPGLYLMGRGHRAINLVVYNTGHPGIGFWSEVGDGGEVYGCLIWGVGTYDTDRSGRTRGSAIYAQNQSGTRRIYENISFRNFTTGMKAYAEEGYVNGFDFEGNITFENGDRLIFVSGRDNPVTNLRMVENYSYRTPSESDAPVRLGYAEVDQNDAIIQNNYFVNGTNEDGAFWVKRFRSLTVTGNVFVSPNMEATWIRPVGTATTVWDHNRYYGGSASPFRMDTATYSFSGWQSRTGFDANSTYSTSRPSGVNAFLRPNQYDANRANLVIYNWDRTDSVNVDLSSFLRPGQRFEIRDAQNFFGSPAVSGVYAGGTVSIPMNLTAVSEIPGETPFRNVHTSTEFGAFVVFRLP